VLAVTHALETYKTLTGEDIEAIIEGKPGPLVDGSVYASEEFAEIAEAYHAAVVTAHERHSKVAVPLPKLNGQRDELGTLTDVTPEGIVVDVDEPEPVPARAELRAGERSKRATKKPAVKRTPAKRNGGATKKNGATNKDGSTQATARKRTAAKKKPRSSDSG